jgi:6-phosphogluconolactonase (cycloisomerase 2 family)
MRTTALIAVVMASLGLVAGPASAAEAGAVFTMSNAADGNEVVVFARADDGTLSHLANYATGGTGTGAGLGSQGAVRLSDDGKWLLAVNAGSDDVSIFRVNGTALELTDTVGSGGDSPISVDISGRFVYVLNGGSPNIAGFRLNRDGELTPIRGGVRPLSTPDSAPAQVEFSPDGRSLVVTEKNTNRIVAYRVTPSGAAGQARVSDAAGLTPFGFEFDPAGRLIVSEAFGGEPDASAVSSYSLGTNRLAVLIDGPVATTETAACWIVVTDNGQYAYTTNTGSDSITGYGLGSDGSLTILNEDGVTAVTGDAPTDMALSDGSGFLYALDSGSDTVSVYQVGADGALTLLQTVVGLPAAAVGLASA